MTHACVFCRSRKIKCDRGQPCSSCIRLKNPDCRYVSKPNPVKRKTSNAVSKDDNGSLIRKELEMLKRKVYELSSGSVLSNGSPISSVSSLGSTTDEPNKGPVYDTELMGILTEEDANRRVNLFATASMSMGHNKIDRRHFGINSWKALMVLDPGLVVLANHARVRMCHEGPTQEEANGAVQTPASEADEVYRQVMKHKEKIKSGCSFEVTRGERSTKNELLEHIIKPPHMFLRNGNRQVTLDDLRLKIQNYLPPKRIIWNYLDMFFSKLYLLVPFVDELDMKGQLYRILQGEPADDRYTSLNISEKADFALLGTLLLLLRITYLSLLPETWDKEESETADIRKDAIGIEAVSLARECLNIFNPVCSMNLKIFQLFLATRVYSSYGPECGDGIDKGDSAFFNSMLFHAAFVLGLHRDPDSVPFYQDGRTKNLARKMWNTLVTFDLSHALEFGEPLNLARFSYDTKIPSFVIEDSNLTNPEHEKAVVESFRFLDRCKELQQFLIEFCDVNKSFTVRELMGKLEHLRDTLLDANGPLNFEPPFPRDLGISGEPNVGKLKIQLQLGYFIYSIYFQMFIYFEKLHLYEVASFFLEEFLKKVLILLLPFCYKIMRNPHKDPIVNFVILPDVQAMLHKASIGSLAFFFRVKHEIVRATKDPSHEGLYQADYTYRAKYDKLQVLSAKITEFCGVIIDITNAFSKKYYFSWLTTKLFKYFRLVVGEDMEKALYREEVSFPILYDTNRISDLIEIIDIGLELHRYKSSVSVRCGDDMVQIAKDAIAASKTMAEFGSGNKTWGVGTESFSPPKDEGSSSSSVTTGMSTDGNGTENANATPSTSTSEPADSVPYPSQTIDALWMQFLGKEPPADSNSQLNQMPFEGDIPFNPSQTLFDEIFRDI